MEKQFPYILELIGPSGSGKSTFIRRALAASKRFDTTKTAALRGLLNHPDISVPGGSVLRRLPMSILTALRIHKIVDSYRDQVLIHAEGQLHEAFFDYLETTIKALEISPIRRALMSHRFLQVITDYTLIQQPVNAGRLVLADEFFLQKTFSLFSDLQTERVEPYLVHVPVPNHIITIDTEPAVCLERVNSRQAGRNILTDHISTEELLERITTCKAFSQVIMDRYEHQGVSTTTVADSDHIGAITTLLRSL